jgi:hypothetical protein
MLMTARRAHDGTPPRTYPRAHRDIVSSSHSSPRPGDQFKTLSLAFPRKEAAMHTGKIVLRAK